MNRIKSKIIDIAVFTAFSLLIGGCATTVPVGPTGLYNVQVNSIANAATGR